MADFKDRSTTCEQQQDFPDFGSILLRLSLAHALNLSTKCELHINLSAPTISAFQTPPPLPLPLLPLLRECVNSDSLGVHHRPHVREHRITSNPNSYDIESPRNSRQQVQAKFRETLQAQLAKQSKASDRSKPLQGKPQGTKWVLKCTGALCKRCFQPLVSVCFSSLIQ